MVLFEGKCRKKAESKNPRVANANKRKLMLSSKYAVLDSKKSIFIKNQEASGLISNLELKIALRNVFLLDGILF